MSCFSRKIRKGKHNWGEGRGKTNILKVEMPECKGEYERKEREDRYRDRGLGSRIESHQRAHREKKWKPGGKEEEKRAPLFNKKTLRERTAL